MRSQSPTTMSGSCHVTEVVEPRLLLEHVRGGRLGRFALQREVHALMPPVLLGVPWLDSFDLDAEAHAPDGELAQPVDRMRRRKRDAVVGPRHLRKARLLEGALEDLKANFSAVVDSASHVSRYRLAKSVIVSG
jgi:hypothetical protein